MELQYVGQVCCGEFISVDSTRVLCGGIEDFLFHIVNLEEVGIEFGEEHLDEVFLLEFKLTDACEANCEISCNRYNGIPVEVISADK